MRDVVINGEVKRWDEYVDSAARKGADELRERVAEPRAGEGDVPAAPYTV